MADNPKTSSSNNTPATHCPQCGCADLYTRKNFPQKLGLAIVILAGGTFLILAAWPSRFYLGVAVLIAAAVADAIIFFFVPKIVVCYRCGRCVHSAVPSHWQPFELSIAEKYRQA